MGMKTAFTLGASVLLSSLLSSPASFAAGGTNIDLNAACGGSFSAWKNDAVREAAASGIGAQGQRVLLNAKQDPKVLAADRKQGVFNLDFITFSNRLVSQNRIDNGTQKLRQNADAFGRAEREFGVPGAVITAFWGLETDFGAFQGDFVTIDALATLAHDCRRPGLFRPQYIAFGRLIDLNMVDANITGAWAGEMGQTQILPSDYIEKGIDGDGDGKISLKTSTLDVIMTTANFLNQLGWRGGEPWLEEVRVPTNKDWSLAGRGEKRTREEWAALGVQGRDGALTADNLPANLILPMGHKGPAFLAHRNFDIYLEWNQSLTYTLTAAHFAARLAGAPKFNPQNPEQGLNGDAMKQLQQKLVNRGHDVGKIDGILGLNTRAAVRQEQARLGLAQDGWPTARLLNAL